MAPNVQDANPAVRALKGAIQGYPSGDARFTATSTELRGSLVLGKQQYFIEPAKRQTPGGVQLIEVAYSPSDVTLPPSLTNDTTAEAFRGGNALPQDVSPSNPLGEVSPSAGTLAGNGTADRSHGTSSVVQAQPPAQQPDGHGNLSRSGGSDPLYYMIRFGIYADTDYCNAYSDWSSRLISLMNSVNGIYNGQVSTQLQIYDGPRCIPGSGSWSSDATTLLSAFSQWCSFDYACNSMTDTHMATGKTLTPSGTAGATYTPGSRGLSQQTMGSDYQKLFTAAHEIGHSFWGEHSDATVLGFDWCGLTYSLMTPAYITDCNMKTQFSSTNAKAVKGDVMSERTDWFPYTAQSSTSSDGFYVTSWWVRHPNIPGVGSTIDLHMYFWTGGKTVTINIFIGCRNGPNFNTNCDFGYTGTTTVSGLLTYSYNGLPLGVTGAWQFWPAYYYNGHYGPYQWSMVQVPVKNALVAQYTGPDTSNGVQVFNFKAWAPSATVHVGDTVIFEFSYNNVGSGNLNFDPYGIFTAARDPSGNNRDFFQTVNLVRPTGFTHWIGWITVNAPGTWIFWPAYYLNGVGWGPYGWHQLLITVYS